MALNNAGFPSTRNKAKQHRPVRVIENKDGTFSPHPLDSIGSSAHRVANATGSFGILGGSNNIRVKMYGPQKGRRNDRKPKRGCRLASTGTIKDMVAGTQRHHRVAGCAGAFPKISLNGERQAKPLLHIPAQRKRVEPVSVIKAEPPKYNCIDPESKWVEPKKR